MKLQIKSINGDWHTFQNEWKIIRSIPDKIEILLEDPYGIQDAVYLGYNARLVEIIEIDGIEYYKVIDIQPIQ